MSKPTSASSTPPPSIEPGPALNDGGTRPKESPFMSATPSSPPVELTALLNEMQKLVVELDYPLTALEFHGCLTGDCPHNHANHCVDSLGEHIREMVAELRTAHRNARAEVSRLRSLVERSDRNLADAYALIRRMESEGLTEEELTHIHRNWRPVALCQLCRDIIAKLDARLSSDSRDSETGDTE